MRYTCVQDVYRLQTDDFDEPETLEAISGMGRRLGKRPWKNAQTPVIYVGSGEGERRVLSSLFSTWEFHYPDLSIEFNAWGNSFGTFFHPTHIYCNSFMMFYVYTDILYHLIIHII